MEAIWEDLTREDEEVESPTWHLDVLLETNQQLRSGKEKILDWSEAKKKLRGTLRMKIKLLSAALEDLYALQEISLCHLL